MCGFIAFDIATRYIDRSSGIITVVRSPSYPYAGNNFIGRARIIVVVVIRTSTNIPVKTLTTIIDRLLRTIRYPPRLYLPVVTSVA